MNQHIGQLALLFLLTTLVGVATTRFSILLSHKLNIVDKPDPRKVHREPIAYLGGFGMLLAFLAGLIPLTWFFPGVVLLHDGFFRVLTAGALMIFLIGFWDDVRPVKAILKLLLQMGVGAFMWAMGVRVEVLSLLGGGEAPVGMLLSLIVTVGWYVALMNSINLTDGLDGLAGGVCLIGAISLVGVSFMIGYSYDTLLGAAISTITAGAVLGFLFWNWHPAKTFMGDGGSLLLGYLLGTASIIGSTKTGTLMALSVPMVALGLPLFETTFSFLRRALRGQHPFKPDRRHLHHRLLDVGLDQRRVVLILHFMTAFLGINSVLMASSQSGALFLNVVFLIFGIVLLIENLKYLETKRMAAAKEAPAPEIPRDPPLAVGAVGKNPA